MISTRAYGAADIDSPVRGQRACAYPTAMIDDGPEGDIQVQPARAGVGLRHVQAWDAPLQRVLMAWCSLVLLLGVCTGYAAMRTLPMEELVRKADTIVIGTVIRQESAWDVDHTAIYTTVTLAVEHVLRGISKDVVTLQVAGGSVGDIGMRTSTDAVFREGERVIVFLDASADPCSVVGMQQGKFTVKDNRVSGMGKTWSLDEFIAAVRTAAR